MAMMYTPIPLDFLEEMGDLSDAEYGRLIRWAQTYHLTGEAAKLSGNERFFAKRVKMQIDRIVSSYDSAVEQKRAAGKAGADRRWHRIADDGTAWQRIADDSKNGYTETYTYTETNNNNTSQGDKAINKQFLPPTVEEVQSYCRERGNTIDAQAFVSFYASKGWKVGKETMKDWRAAVRTWERRQEEDKQKPHPKKLGLSYSERMQVLKELHDEYREAGV